MSQTTGTKSLSVEALERLEGDTPSGATYASFRVECVLDEHLRVKRLG